MLGSACRAPLSRALAGAARELRFAERAASRVATPRAAAAGARGSRPPAAAPRCCRSVAACAAAGGDASGAASDGADVGPINKSVIQLTPRTYAYLLANTREPAALRACREATSGLHGSQMQVPPEQGALLGLLVELSGARRALEVGTYTGYSSTAIALALPADGALVTCDVNAETMAVARATWAAAGVAHKVDARLGRAVETLDAMLRDEAAAGSFDLCFIDADKRAYGDYFDRAMQLVRVGGLIAVDNTLWYGKVAEAEVQDKQTIALREFNARVLSDERVTHAMVPIGDGLTLLRRRS